MLSTENYIKMEDKSIYKLLTDAIEVAQARGDEEVLRILARAINSYLTLLENRNNKDGEKEVD